MSLVLDANAYSAFKSGNREIVPILEECEQIIVPIIVVGELLSGFMQGIRFDKNNRELDEFLKQPGVLSHKITTADAGRYASLVKSLRQAGTPLPMNDVWIAAVALAYGGRILTRDIHFNKIPGIMPIRWD